MAEDFDSMNNDFEDDSGDGGGWLATYGDMMTLLMCFFVLLFSMSQIKKKKFEQLKQTLKKSIGKQDVPEAGTREGLTMQKREKNKQPKSVDELGGMIPKKQKDSLVSDVNEFIFKNKLGGKVEVDSNENGAVITVSNVVLFPSGEDELTEGGNKLMKKISKILEDFSYRITIVGHTDNIPVQNKESEIETNWELSTTRACEVVRFLIKNGIDPKLLTAAGKGKYHPVASNKTEEGRAENRRVEIIYKRTQSVPKKVFTPDNIPNGTVENK